MIYIVIFILFILLIWFSLIYVRKSMWDTVHRNLLDLEDHFNGKVIRRSALSRPIFHGKINGREITLNFSTEKLESGRISYVDISYNIPARFTCTVAKKSWLEKQQAGKLEDFLEIQNDSGETVIIRPASSEEVQNMKQAPQLINLINHLSRLSYIFINSTGLLCEFESSEIARDTEFAKLSTTLELIEELGARVS